MRIKPLTIILVMLAGLLNRRQQEMIDYLKEENKVLREKLGKKRIWINIDQKIRLAILGKHLGKRTLAQVCCAFSADTVLRWHRMLVASKYDSSKCRKRGRPQIKNYCEHYHHERPHQRIDNNIITPLSQGTGKIECKERLGGLLKFYRRAA
jgi:hypothetical protein